LDSANAELWRLKARALKKLDRLEEALSCCKLAQDINPSRADSGKLLREEGDILAKMGRNDEEVECYDRILEIDPRDILIWTLKGAALILLGCFEKALKCHERALEIDPRDPPSWGLKGIALQKLERFEEALVCFNRGLEIDPSVVDFWTDKVAALFGLSRYEEALLCCEKGLQLWPGDTRLNEAKEIARNAIRRR